MPEENEGPIWECPSCGYELEDEEGIKPIGLNFMSVSMSGEAAPLPAQVCPKCRVVSLSEVVFDKLTETLYSKIVTI